MTPCPKCKRHVREAACPFCGAIMSLTNRRVVRVSRTAMFAAGALALAECSSPVAFYGCPPPPTMCGAPDDAAAQDEFIVTWSDASAPSDASADAALESASDSTSDSDSGSGSDSDSDSD